MLTVPAHLTQQIDRLQESAPQLGREVVQALDTAVQALIDRDPTAIDRLNEAETQIDRHELDLEEDCLHCLALEQPVARDLRLIVGMIKIIAELERIGDLSVGLAEQARYLGQAGVVLDQLQHLPEMAKHVREMVSRVVQAMAETDADGAEEVRKMDDDADRMHRRTYEVVERRASGGDSELLGIQLLNVSRRLERIADHAVSIAEDVLYIARGRIARHGSSGRKWPEMA